MKNSFLIFFFIGFISFLQGQYSVCGSVSEGNIPESDVEIVILETDASVFSDTSGNFCFTGIAAGDYSIQAYALDGRESEIYRIRVSEDIQDLEIQFQITDLETAVIKGRYDASDEAKDHSIKTEVVDLRQQTESAVSVERLMNRSSGIRIRNTGGLGAEADVVVGGFNGKSIKFLKDGIPIDYLGSSAGLTKLPLGSADYIEVYKGVMPTEVGIDALGGAVNSNPSISSGFYSMGSYFFSMAKDKKGYSSTPGLYRMSLNEENRTFIESELHISKDNLFPARQLSIVNEHLGYFYDEGKDAYSIQYFDPTAMQLLGSIDLKDAIQAYRPDARWTDDFGNNLVRTGTLALDTVDGKLYVSIVFLEAAEFNLIPEDDNHFYLAVIDIATQQFEKIISYPDVQTVGFFVSENKATAADENGNMYFCSWGWNQFNSHRPSKVFRIKSGETDFDPDWAIDIENLFGPMRIAQSIISFNGKIYLHISEQPYGFSDDDPETIKMGYYEFDPNFPDEPKKLDIPDSNPSSRINVFSIIDDRLYVAVPNLENGLFNGFYSIDKDGFIQKEIRIAHKYRPTRLYRLKGQ